VAARDALSKLTDLISSPSSPPQPETVSLVTALQVDLNQWIIKIKIKIKTANEDEHRVYIDAELKKICAIYCEPPAVDQFYLDFDKEDLFSGTLHCEAFLASLLDNFTKHFNIDMDTQTLQEMKVDTLSLNFLSLDSHYVAYILGLWTSNWSVETLLPSLFPFPPPFIRKSQPKTIPCTRLSL
jgi:hypothetical protein